MTGIVSKNPELGSSRGWKKTTLFLNSQLEPGDALEILSNGSLSLGEFKNQFSSLLQRARLLLFWRSQFRNKIVTGLLRSPDLAGPPHVW